MNAQPSLCKGFTFTHLQMAVTNSQWNLIASIKLLVTVFGSTKKICRQTRKNEEVPQKLLFDLFVSVVKYAKYRNIDIQKWITKRYPRFCIYCGEKVCNCTLPGIQRPLIPCDVTQIKPDTKLSLRRFQLRDFTVYPNDKSYTAKLIRAMHLSEEVYELLIEIFKDIIGQSDILKITEEVVDVLERTISFASTFDIDFEALVLGMLPTQPP